MTNSLSASAADTALIGTVLRCVASDLGVILGEPFYIENERVERVHERPAGSGKIHISFKLGLKSDNARIKHGTLLMPLPEAITMACLLLMIPSETVALRRNESKLDAGLKDAMLEIGNMI